MIFENSMGTMVILLPAPKNPVTPLDLQFRHRYVVTYIRKLDMLCAVSPYSVLDPLFSIPHKNDKNRSMFVHVTQKQSKNSGISLNIKMFCL